MLTLLISILFFILPRLSLAEDWTGISDCGTYQVNGVVRTIKHIPIIVINEKTQSEIQVALPILNEAKVAPYLNKTIAATIVIDRKASGSEVMGTLKVIEERIPNPLNPKDTGIKFISKVECKK